MKKVLLTLALLCSTVVSAKVMVKGTLKIGDKEVSQTVVLENDQTRFHYWTPDGLMLVGQIQESNAEGAKVLLLFGHRDKNTNPTDATVRFERILSNKVITHRWNQTAIIEVSRADSPDLTLYITLSQVD